VGGASLLITIILNRFIHTYMWQQNSVRHNLSSNRAFKKMERCAGERGKGFFWSVDPNFEHMFAEQASGSEKLASGGTGKKSKKAGASVLGPPMKRSVKGESNGGFLPPPLTHAPLAMKGIATTGATTYAAMVQRQPATLAAIKPEAEAAALLTTAQAKSAHALGVCAPPSTSLPAPTATTPASLPSLPRIPFVVAPLPPSFKSAPSSTSTASPSDPAPTAPPTTTISSGTGTGTAQLNPHESLVLHEGTLFLHPTIFADLTPEHLRALEALGVQKAIEVLKGHIVSYLREVGRRGGRGRGRGRRRGGARGGGPERGSAPGGVKVGDIVEESAAEGVTETANSNVGDEKVGCVPTAPTAPENGEVREESPIVVVDDDEEEEGRAVKRRKVEGRDVDVERKSVEGMEGVSATG
jgi:forkhead box protein K